MKQHIYDKINEVLEQFDHDDSKTTEHLFHLFKSITPYLMKQDTETISNLTRTLLERMPSEPIPDQYSYNIGKLHALTELINMIDERHRLKDVADNLSLDERVVLSFLSMNRNCFPVDLADNYSHLNIESAKRILTDLSHKSLVSIKENGNLKTYSITSDGFVVSNLS